eukprot:4926080-Alexandrium_andersonii.AAC.1
MHLLRAAAPEIPRSTLVEFDRMPEAALERILGGALPEDGRARAAAGAADGGLGLRRTVPVASAAFVASRTE